MTSVMHEFLDTEVRHERTRPEVSEFYPHIYGGMARDIYVTREQFARFWRMSVEYIDDLQFNSKVLDQMEPGGESLGYKMKEWVWKTNGRHKWKYTLIKYRITIIDYSRNPYLDSNQSGA